MNNTSYVLRDKRALYRRAIKLAENDLAASGRPRPGSIKGEVVDYDAMKAWDRDHSALVVKYLNMFNR